MDEKLLLLIMIIAGSGLRLNYFFPLAHYFSAGTQGAPEHPLPNRGKPCPPCRWSCVDLCPPLVARDSH